jgi:hypothetical protein
MNIQDLISGKTRLEFGNVEQIRAIDSHAEEIRLQLAEGDEEVLKLYRLEFAVSGTAVIEIEAHDVDEAREKAREEIGQDDIDDLDYDFIEANSLRILGEG